MYAIGISFEPPVIGTLPGYFKKNSNSGKHLFTQPSFHLLMFFLPLESFLLLQQKESIFPWNLLFWGSVVKGSDQKGLCQRASKSGVLRARIQLGSVVKILLPMALQKRLAKRSQTVSSKHFVRAVNTTRVQQVSLNFNPNWWTECWLEILSESKCLISWKFSTTVVR